MLICALKWIKRKKSKFNRLQIEVFFFPSISPTAHLCTLPPPPPYISPLNVDPQNLSFICICSGLINRILWYLLKRLLKWANKKWKNFNIYNIVLLKTSGDIIILHLCTRNLDDMIYTSWDIECDSNYGSFFTLLHPLPLNSQKSEFWKNEKRW